MKTGTWDKSEHDLLVEALNLFGKDWKKVKAHVGTRTKTQIVQHVYHMKSDFTKLAQPQPPATESAFASFSEN